MHSVTRKIMLPYQHFLLLMRYLLLIFVILIAGEGAHAEIVTARIVDADTNEPIAARVYLQDDTGKFLHVTNDQGTAVPYAVQRSATSQEVHTSVSAHPFHADLSPGRYTLTVERGKEYLPATRTVQVPNETTAPLTIRLKRWVDMAERGWYSGETHVHRPVDELPTLQLAEDLNVAFPLTAWVTDTEHAPATHNKNRRAVPDARLARIDGTHVYWPVNTEYEIFTVRGQRHTLGAVFVLNHQQALALSAPPVGPIAHEARRQGGFLELDKHNWPWSMMLVPQMQVELFELANNHMWRTEFQFKDWYPEYVGRSMGVDLVDGGFTERGWIEFGFQNYYALLNCGFRMQPTAGSASGVHPVPLGFGRVYVDVEGDFAYEKWIDGLLRGRSFVTTGPMLTMTAERLSNSRVRVSGLLEAATKPQRLEVLLNGQVATAIDVAPANVSGNATPSAHFHVPFAVELPLEGTSWIAARGYTENGNGRVRFAHTAPQYFQDPQRPLRPTSGQRNYLVDRVREELERSRSMLSEASIAEFESALRTLEQIRVEDE